MFDLTDEEKRAAYAKIKEAAFASDIAAQENPCLIIVGGQPAAGKSRLMELSMAWLDHNAVIIDGDKYRQFHPYEKELFAQYGQECSIHTHKAVAQWAGMLFKEAGENKYNIIQESTLRDSATLSIVADKVRQAGYSVTLRVLAVNELESLQGNYCRYYNQLEAYKKDPANAIIPRFTPVEHHNEAYQNLLATVAKVEKQGISIELYNREGQCLYNSTIHARDEITAAAQINQIRAAVWTEEKYKVFAERNCRLLELMKQNNAPAKDKALVGNLTEKAKGKIKQPRIESKTKGRSR
jgi:UDP-N-acetylglucosamine kinase